MSSRIKDIDQTVTADQLQAILASLFFAVDEASFIEAKKIALTTLLSSAVIANNSNNYQAITGQAFYNSVMTTSRFGVGRMATDDQVRLIDQSNSSGLLTSGAQYAMKEAWMKDWFTKNGIPTIFVKSADSLVGGGAVAWQTTGRIASLPITNVTGLQLSPVLETGVELDNGYCMIVIKSDTDRERVLMDYYWAAGEFVRDIGSHFSVNISSDHRRLFIKSRGVNQTNVRVSVTGNFTTR